MRRCLTRRYPGGRRRLPPGYSVTTRPQSRPLGTIDHVERPAPGRGAGTLPPASPLDRGFQPADQHPHADLVALHDAGLRPGPGVGQSGDTRVPDAGGGGRPGADVGAGFHPLAGTRPAWRVAGAAAGGSGAGTFAGRRAGGAERPDGRAPRPGKPAGLLRRRRHLPVRCSLGPGLSGGDLPAAPGPGPHGGRRRRGAVRAGPGQQPCDGQAPVRRRNGGTPGDADRRIGSPQCRSGRGDGPDARPDPALGGRPREPAGPSGGRGRQKRRAGQHDQVPAPDGPDRDIGAGRVAGRAARDHRRHHDRRVDPAGPGASAGRTGGRRLEAGLQRPRRPPAS